MGRVYLSPCLNDGYYFDGSEVGKRLVMLGREGQDVALSSHGLGAKQR